MFCIFIYIIFSSTYCIKTSYIGNIMAKNLLKIENVYFAFTNIDKPLKDRFDTSGLTQKFNSTIILSKDQAKEFKRQKLNKTVDILS